MVSHILYPLFFLCFFLPLSLHALEFTVCAKNWENDLDTKVQAEEIETNQYRETSRLLASLPGLSVRNEGHMTRVSIRGAKADQTLVLVNGIPMNDPSDPNNTFDFTNLEPEDIEEIKIITGAEALEYGSSAIGGAVKITTKKGCGPLKTKGRVEHGSSKTTNATASLQGEDHGVSYYLNTVGKRTGRGSRFNPLHGNDVSNFNKDMNAETRLGAQIQDNWRMDLFAHGDRQNMRVDGFPIGDLPQEVGDRGTKKSDMIALKNQVLLLNQQWLHQVDASHMDIHRRYWYPLEHTHADFEGQRNFLKYETSYKFHDCFKLMAESGWQQDEAKLKGLEKSLDQSYLKLKTEGLTGHNHCFTLSGRLDKTQNIRVHKTIQATATFQLLCDMILKANAGTGFRAPSLQDMFGLAPFQVPNDHLKPEKNKTAEVGIENEFAQGQVKTALTSFYNRIHHIIVWDHEIRQTVNRDRRVIKGLEAKVLFDPDPDWSLSVSYTFIHAKDGGPKRSVIRQPKHKETLNLTWQALECLEIFSGIVCESKLHDRTFLKRVTLPVTTDVRVGANYLVTDYVTVFGRIENLLDQKREKVFGYGRPRRGLYVGIKMEM